jgi:hypothetical protein
MPEKEYQRFISGSCTTEERKRALRKYENVLPRRPHQMHMIQKNREFIDSYSLRRCMVPEVHKTPEEVIDSVKEKMCALYSIVRGFAWYMITRLFQMALNCLFLLFLLCAGRIRV